MSTIVASVDVLNNTLPCLERPTLPVGCPLTNWATVQSCFSLLLYFHNFRAAAVIIFNSAVRHLAPVVVLQPVEKTAVVHLLNRLVAVSTDCHNVFRVVAPSVTFRNNVVLLKDLFVVLATDEATVHCCNSSL